jgi:hypothetical protein
MKKTLMVASLAVGLLVVSASPSFAWWRGGWWGPGVWVVPPPVVIAPAPAPVVVAPAPVITTPAPVYAEQQPQEQQPAEAESYWYFCPSAHAYYPSVQSCSEAWVKVPPRTP